MANIGVFGLLLAKQRSKIGKTSHKIAKEIGISQNSLMQWEHAETFPNEDRLPLIAEKYQIKEKKLLVALNSSKKQRIEEKAARKAKTKSQKSDDQLFGGQVSRYISIKGICSSRKHH